MRLPVSIQQWRVRSSGGKIFIDSRRLAEYHIYDQQVLYMRLLLVGGARKSLKKTPLVPQRELSSKVYPKSISVDEASTPTSTLKSTSIAKQRRSRRLKRQRISLTGEMVEAKHDWPTCPMCLNAFSEEDQKNSGDCICCTKCGRWFHVECSGMQKEWVDHLALDCKQWGLQCVDVAKKVRKLEGKGWVKRTNLSQR